MSLPLPPPPATEGGEEGSRFPARMSIESERDLSALRRVGRTVALVLQALRAYVRADVTTAEIDAYGAQLLAQYGARSAPQLFYRFPGTLCISVNDEAVHGV